jgi:hypothetical protein
MQWWNNTSSDSEPRKLIEARMVEVLKVELPKTNDFPTLMQWWNNTSSDSEPRKLIEARMVEVLKKTNDFPTLMQWWKKTSSDSEPRKLIEARMVEVLKEISENNIPEWFISFIKNPSNLPNFIKNEFKQKCQEIYSNL